MNKEEEADKRGRDSRSPPHPERGYQEMRFLGFLMLGLLGATATVATFAVTKLRTTVDLIFSQLSRSTSSWKNGCSFRTGFQEEARKRYTRCMREEYEAKMERVERIRQMQSVFDRERNKFSRSYDSWQQHGPGAYHQHFQRNDWYWTEDTSFRDHYSNFRETPWASARSLLSHHYSVLGLDRLQTIHYTDDEIKSAFRAKAKEFHPDQNQDNKEVAEAKFKEVMASYEAIKSERKNNRHCQYGA